MPEIPQSPEPPQPQKPEKSIRILNVNDRDIPRYVNEETLRREGFTVVSVATGAEALAAARADIDVILLDVHLPDLDGFEICKRLKSDPETANVIVLLTSATFVTAKNKVAGLDSGADGYLVQPYESAELHATLRSLLRARAAERRAQALAHELRAAMEVRDEFLAMLGHELRNPIGTMTTALHLVTGNREPESLDRYHTIMQRQVTNLTRIVDDLLDVARITRGKVSLSRDVVDLRDVAERCVQSLANEIAAAGHTVHIEVAHTKVLVIGDVVRLEQIATNLVTNAVKYTPRGGHVWIRVGHDGGRARLEVADDGIGMDAQMRARVFDLFVQGKQSIDRSRGGLGLGLTVVRQLVELHGGSVAAFSDGDGSGSRFVVELPLAPSGSVASSSAVEVPEPSGGVRVVVIEDNTDARLSLQEALSALGHQVDAAADGQAGLDLAVARRPDVVLVDIGLPCLDGYEVAREIRARLGDAQPRLIAMTGYGQPEDQRRAKEAGFDAHMVKPVSLAKLQRLLAGMTPRGGRPSNPGPA